MNSFKTKALIYKPAKNAMQSGYVVNDFWELKFLQNAPLNLDPLMGWVGSNDTSKQIILKFSTERLLGTQYSMHTVRAEQDVTT